MNRNWVECDSIELNNLYYELWSALSNKYNIKQTPKFYLNKGNSTHYRGEYFSEFGRTPIVIINGLYKNHPAEMAKNVILHELTHHIADTKSGRRCIHNYYWKRIAREVGNIFGETITTYCDSKDPIIEEAKSLKKKRVKNSNTYTVICTKCGKHFTYHKECWWFKDKNHVDVGTCPYCKGHSFDVKRG